MVHLTGKVVPITEATDGLGRGTAIALAQRGATVLVHGRNRARGETVLAEVQPLGVPTPGSIWPISGSWPISEKWLMPSSPASLVSMRW
jgi:hypothetical protein